MKKDEIILTDEQKQELNNLSIMYKEASDEYSSAEAKKNAINSMVKAAMKDFGVSKFVSDSGISLSITSRPNIKWDEDKLLAFCKESDVSGLVKTKEYVDMDVLESALYNGAIKPDQLKPLQEVKPDIITLRCSQKKLLTE